MKKIVSRVVATTMAVVLLLTMLTACGTSISGKYENELLGLSFEFKSGGNVNFTYPKFDLSSLSMSDVMVEGKYEIKDDKIILIFDDEGAKDYAGELSFEQGDGYVKIDGITFTK